MVTADAPALRRQGLRLSGGTQPPWLAQEVAARMVDRLSWLRRAPASAAVWRATNPSLWPDESLPLLQALPTPPQLWQVGPQSALQPVQEGGASGWRTALPRWLGRSAPAPAPGGVDLLWSNLNLHRSLEVRATLAQWLSHLAFDGVLMFSTLGPLTARGLQRVFDASGWGPALPDWTDMHDWGDRLVDAGFSDPVMDQEVLTLTYASPEALLTELRGFWGNTHPERFAGLRTPGWRQLLLAALAAELRGPDGRLHLSVEVVYGHAVKLPRAPAIQAETRVDLADMRRQLSRTRR